jgi:hypothetical protein
MGTRRSPLINSLNVDERTVQDQQFSSIGLEAEDILVKRIYTESGNI